MSKNCSRWVHIFKELLALGTYLLTKEESASYLKGAATEPTTFFWCALVVFALLEGEFSLALAFAVSSDFGQRGEAA